MPDDKSRISIHIFVALASAMVFACVQADDEKSLPPESRSFRSPSGNYVLEVRAIDGWQQPYTKAELYRVGNQGRESLWSTDLPHRYGPGQVIVSDSGRVLIIDEWIKSPGKYAIMLFSERGQLIARYGIRDIEAVSGIHRSEIVTRATSGPWMSADPVLMPSRESVIVEAGGKPLSISLLSGRLAKLGEKQPGDSGR